MTSEAIELKCWPEPFDAIWEGRKLFEIRSETDRKFEVGNMLHLHEWWTLHNGVSDNQGYSGREIRAEVTYLIRGPAWNGMVPAGVVVMGIKVLEKQEH
jgi:hypothetical protein